MKAAIWTLTLAVGMAIPAFSQSLEFQREVAQKRAVTLGDVVMMFHGLVNDTDPQLTEDKAFAALVQKKLIPEDWNSDLKEPASLGQISYIICQLLDISGGIMQHATFNCRRYCYRECARLRLVKPGGPHSQVPGRDIVAIMGRIEDILTNQKSKP
jgi:hypothetical protein